MFAIRFVVFFTPNCVVEMFSLYWLLFFFAFLFIFQMYYWFNSTLAAVKKFPSPKYFPVVGHLHHLLNADEVLIFKKLRYFAKKFKSAYHLFQTNAFYAVFLIRPQEMQAILSNVKHNEKSDIYMLFDEWLGEGLLTSGGAKWQQRRRILTPAFHFSILRQFIGTFNQNASSLARELKENTNNTINLSSLVCKCSLNTIAESAMGTKLTESNDKNSYRGAICKMGEIMLYRIIRPWLYFRITNLFTTTFIRERYLLWYLKTFTLQVIEQREKNFHSDSTKLDEVDDVGMKKNRLAMLDLLLYAKKNNEIDLEGIREEVDTFMFEGHDTISIAVSFCLMLLACNKDCQAKAYQEVLKILNDNREPTMEDLNKMTYLEMVLKETMRLYPSVPLISRVVGEDVTLDTGLVIPNGTRVILNIFDTHRLPDIYPDPDVFDPDRFLPENIATRHPFAHIPFSAGSRNCIGQKYAMLNMKSMVASVLKENELLPVDTPETVTLIASMILRTKDPIRIKVKPRSSF